ncbi:MAG: TIM barrel protein [Pseudomonadota bacterium]
MTITFSANLGFLWSDRPFLQRIEAARHADFALVEFHDQAQLENPDDIVAALDGMKVVGLNVHMGESAGCAALPGEEDRAKREIAEATETARALGAGAVHVLSGRTDDPAGADRLVARLKEATAAAPEITFLIEPICPQANPGYFLTTVEQAADIIRRVETRNAKIMFDCFHVQRAGGDVLARFKAHADLIGHVQIAGGYTRAEPDHGELNYHFLLPAIQDAGYEGPFGCEYHPEGSVEDGLGWRDAFLWSGSM